VQVEPPPAPPTARYTVTMNIVWTSSTHPGTVPSGAHVSSPVLAVHQTPGAMFVVNGLASPGIEAMAERGATSGLVAELGSTPGVSSVQTRAGVTGSGSRSFTIDVTQADDLISMVTMLAPSPDWFLGFGDLDLFVGGAWVDTFTFPLANYDAGTDSGSNFTSGDADTQPPLPISGPRDAPFIAAAAENPFGTVTITRIG
jgi:hypothetical protein